MATQTRFPWKRNSDGQGDELIGDNVVDQEGENTTGQDSELSRGDQQQQLDKPMVYTSQWATLFIVVNVTVGVGLLAMPYVMQEAGIVSSMIIQLVLLALIMITCIMCVELTVKSEVNSYHQIIQVHCHSTVYQLTQASIILMVFGAAVAYIVTMGDQADRLFDSWYGDSFCHKWYMNRKFSMSILTLVAIKPLCSARTVDFLKYASFLGVASIGFVFYVVVAEFRNHNQVAQDVNYYPKSMSDIISILPVFGLAYQCHLSLVPTVATIRRSDKPKAFVTSSVAMIIAMIIYSTISILAVLTFGSAIQTDLTESYSGKEWYVPTTIAIIGIKCILTLPAAFLPARLSLVDLLTNNWSRFAQFSEPVRRIAVTEVFLDLALLMALYVPNILVAVNLLGCLGVMFIFSLPGLAYINLVKQNRLEKQLAVGLDPKVPNYTGRDTMKRVASYFMIFFGTIMTFIVLYKSIEEMMTSKSSVPLCQP